MRIAILVNQFPSMSQTFVLNQVTSLIDLGCQVDIYASTPGDEDCVHPDVERYGLVGKTYFWPRVKGNVVQRALQGIGVLAAGLPRHPGLLLLALRTLRYRKQIPWSALYCAMAGIYRRNNAYDIIHCHFGPNGLKAAIMRDLGVLQGRLFTTFHGYDMTSYIRLRGENAYDLLFERGDCFLPISEHWKKQLIALGCDEARTIVHRVGIHCGRFGSIPNKPVVGGKIRLVSIARLVEKKGLEYLIRAVAALLKRRPDVDCRIIGDGPLRPRLQQLIDELGVAGAVTLFGWRDEDDIIRILQTAHMLVAPSVTASDGDQEGIPVVLMEAMAMGLPIISTWHSGIPELVRHGVTGLLVPEGDVEALEDALEQLCARPDSWRRLGQAGREHVQAHHDIDKQNRRLVDLYHQALGYRTVPGDVSGRSAVPFGKPGYESAFAGGLGRGAAGQRDPAMRRPR